ARHVRAGAPAGSRAGAGGPRRCGRPRGATRGLGAHGMAEDPIAPRPSAAPSPDSRDPAPLRLPVLLGPSRLPPWAALALPRHPSRPGVARLALGPAWAPAERRRAAPRELGAGVPPRLRPLP